jgi:hypothetical protein
MCFLVWAEQLYQPSSQTATIKVLNNSSVCPIFIFTYADIIRHNVASELGRVFALWLTKRFNYVLDKHVFLMLAFDLPISACEEPLGVAVFVKYNCIWDGDFCFGLP